MVAVVVRAKVVVGAKVVSVVVNEEGGDGEVVKVALSGRERREGRRGNLNHGINESEILNP